MTETTPSATPPLTASALSEDERLADFTRDVEHDVANIKDMAYLAANAVERAIGRSHKDITHRKDFYFIPDDQRDATAFAVYHLRHLIKDFYDKYYAALEAK